MPNEKVLQEKKKIVEDLVAMIKGSVAGVIVDYKGIDVANDTKLRAELRAAGVSYCVAKNTMLRFAAKEVGLDGLNEVLEGTTAIAISENDPIAPAKIIAKYSKQLNDVFNIKGGYMDGAVVDVATVEELASIPSKPELVAKMLSSLNAPIANLAVVLDQIAKKSA